MADLYGFLIFISLFLESQKPTPWFSWAVHEGSAFSPFPYNMSALVWTLLLHKLTHCQDTGHGKTAVWRCKLCWALLDIGPELLKDIFFWPTEASSKATKSLFAFTNGKRCGITNALQYQSVPDSLRKWLQLLLHLIAKVLAPEGQLNHDTLSNSCTKDESYTYDSSWPCSNSSGWNDGERMFWLLTPKKSCMDSWRNGFASSAESTKICVARASLRKSHRLNSASQSMAQKKPVVPTDPIYVYIIVWYISYVVYIICGIYIYMCVCVSILYVMCQQSNFRNDLEPTFGWRSNHY